MRTILGDMGPRDQRAVELQLFVSSLVPDTDFMGKLALFPDLEVRHSLGVSRAD